eukprot:TRINITY_DN4576_c0_g1_i1.p1 TRINITY_DN4576_c0_g1~~TRINITY_DN4576_c0_g1_i1.p1  ORF type:complete len:161 (-),score=13.29 TRINITY_DN4576_c0_g1_i1:140-562(-)
MTGLREPDPTPLDDFLAMCPALWERGVIALFPKLYDEYHEVRQAWLEKVLVDQTGEDQPARSLIEYITFCISGDAILLMKTAEDAQNLVKRSPLVKVGDRIFFQHWNEVNKTKLQYRWAFNKVLLRDPPPGPSAAVRHAS